MSSARVEDLAQDEVHVWHVDPQAVSATLWESRARSLLDADEWRGLPHRAPEETRMAWLAAHVATRVALSRYAPVTPASWRFDREPGRRPEIAAPDTPAPLYFSLSHTTGRSACAVARTPLVGVDTEAVQADLTLADLPMRHLAEEERAGLSARPPEEHAEAFTALWSLKEAYAKACGLGLELPLSWLAFEPQADLETGPVRVEARFDPRLGDTSQRWVFWLLRPSAGLVLATAASNGAGDPPDVRIRTLPLEDLL